jgi:3-oxoadipate enol-lactonase
MALQDDFDRGLLNRRAVLGDAWVDQSIGRANGFNADFQDLITRWAWNDTWGRPGLARDTRRLIVLVITASLGRWDEFDLHGRAAVRGGLSVEAIREALIQTAIYAGVPAANTAFRRMTEILRDEGCLPGPAPLTPGTRVVRHRTFSQPQLAVAVQGPDPAAEGARVPVAMSHALGLDHTMWDALAAQLAADGHPVLRWDHRGQGASSPGPRPCTMDALVGDALRVVSEWTDRPVVFVGLSMGGMVGLGLAAQRPDRLAGLVIAHSTAAHAPGADAVWAQRMAAVREGGVAAVADAAMERFFTAAWRAAHSESVARWRRVLTATPAEGYLAACEAVAGLDGAAWPAAVRCPTLVIAGTHDAGTTPAMADAIAQGIPGGARRVTLDAAHLGVLEQPAAFAAAVQAFLAELR